MKTIQLQTVKKIEKKLLQISLKPPFVTVGARLMKNYWGNPYSRSRPPFLQFTQHCPRKIKKMRKGKLSLEDQLGIPDLTQLISYPTKQIFASVKISCQP